MGEHYMGILITAAQSLVRIEDMLCDFIDVMTELQQDQNKLLSSINDKYEKSVK